MTEFPANIQDILTRLITIAGRMQQPHGTNEVDQEDQTDRQRDGQTI